MNGWWSDDVDKLMRRVIASESLRLRQKCTICGSVGGGPMASGARQARSGKEEGNEQGMEMEMETELETEMRRARRRGKATVRDRNQDGSCLLVALSRSPFLIHAQACSVLNERK